MVIDQFLRLAKNVASVALLVEVAAHSIDASVTRTDVLEQVRTRQTSANLVVLWPLVEDSIDDWPDKEPVAASAPHHVRALLKFLILFLQ